MNVKKKGEKSLLPGQSSLFMLLVLLLVVSLALVACSSDSETSTDPDPATEENETPANEPEEPVEITSFQQAPMLDGMDLPPVEERLPNEPKITNEMPADMLDYEIGQYGGTLRTVTSVVEWDADVFVMANEPLLNTPGILGEEITGNVLLGYDVSDDQTEFTFYMREGLKWSDGEPVTVEDVRFTVEDMLFNEEVTPVFPNWLRSGGSSEGEPMTFEVINDYEFKITFDEPYGGFPLRMAIQGWRGYTDLLNPSHHLKQYHADYTPLEELEPLIEEEGLEPGEWTSLFTAKNAPNWDLTRNKSLDYPALYPWILTEVTDTTRTLERNPYYFKVDAEGNQLPYIDQVTSYLVQDIEMVTMKTIAGEVDFSRESAALVRMPLYRENEENGNYQAHLFNMHVTPTDVFLNLTHEDPVWREVVQDIRFRKALDLALDKEEIVDAIYYGFADVGSLGSQTRDLEEANRLLDEMGMTIGSDGFRVGPDGNRFTIPFEVGAQAPDIVPLTELIVEHWKELHLDVDMKTIDQTLWGTRNTANELKATMIWTHTPLWWHDDMGLGLWAPLWNMWRTSGGSQGEEPPEEVKEFYDLLNQVSISPHEEAMQTNQQLLEHLSENLWYFVHIENVQQPLIVNKNLGNIADSGYAIGVNFSGEQFFFRQ